MTKKDSGGAVSATCRPAAPSRSRTRAPTATLNDRPHRAFDLAGLLEVAPGDDPVLETRLEPDCLGHLVGLRGHARTCREEPGREDRPTDRDRSRDEQRSREAVEERAGRGLAQRLRGGGDAGVGGPLAATNAPPTDPVAATATS